MEPNGLYPSICTIEENQNLASLFLHKIVTTKETLELYSALLRLDAIVDMIVINSRLYRTSLTTLKLNFLKPVSSRASIRYVLLRERYLNFFIFSLSDWSCSFILARSSASSTYQIFFNTFSFTMILPIASIRTLLKVSYKVNLNKQTTPLISSLCASLIS